MTNQYSYVDSFSNTKPELPKKKIAESNISSAAKVYMLSRMNDNGAVKTYRNGNHNGQKYMTGEDFVTYFQQRGKTSVRPENVAKRTESSAEIYRSRPMTAQSDNTAHYRKQTYGAPNVVESVKIRKPVEKKTESDTRMFGKLEEDVKIYTPGSKRSGNERIADDKTSTFIKTDRPGLAKLQKAKEEWLPDEKIVNVEKKKRSRSFSGMALAIAGVAISLMLIVSGSVLMSGANREIKDLENELGQLTSVEKELKAELEIKNDVNVLLDKATGELGMIHKEYVEANYIDVGGSDKVEVHEKDSEKNVGLAAILSAFGIGN